MLLKKFLQLFFKKKVGKGKVKLTYISCCEIRYYINNSYHSAWDLINYAYSFPYYFFFCLISFFFFLAISFMSACFWTRARELVENIIRNMSVFQKYLMVHLDEHKIKWGPMLNYGWPCASNSLIHNLAFSSPSHKPCLLFKLDYEWFIEVKILATAMKPLSYACRH